MEHFSLDPLKGDWAYMPYRFAGQGSEPDGGLWETAESPMCSVAGHLEKSLRFRAEDDSELNPPRLDLLPCKFDRHRLNILDIRLRDWQRIVSRKQHARRDDH